MAQVQISGFADEICMDFEEQLKTVTGLGMHYICLRNANAKGIADYTLQEVETYLIPLLNKYEVRVSSLGSPIGKVRIDEPEAVAKQREQLDTLCQIAKLLNVKYIRVFSFYPDPAKEIDAQANEVLEGMRNFIDIAEKHDIILLHENEKDIFGDTVDRCKYLMENLYSEHFVAAFDFANFVQCGQNAAHAWEMMQEYVHYIHVKDAMADTMQNVLFGTGDGQAREILRHALLDLNYQGFMTLEPHLVRFDTLQSLELKDAKKIITENLAKDGADGYGKTYRALTAILQELGVSYE